MPRRNQRRQIEAQHFEELGPAYRFTRDPQEAEIRAEVRRSRADQARKRLTTASNDWTRCIVPGCKFQTLKELQNGIEFPICSMHAVAVWDHVEKLDRLPAIRQSRAGLESRRDVIRAERAARDAADEAEYREAYRNNLVDGDIYYVRANGLIKVGWTTDLHSRLRAYGPQAVLLCHYPGTRNDETALHRQLTPARAKGREWYEDGSILASFIARAVAEHGQPLVRVQWTEPKKSSVKPKGWS